MALRRTSGRAVQFNEYGGVDVLQVVEVERPEPGPGEVVVRVLAAGINHMEAYLRQGKFVDEIPGELPRRQGSDFSGMVHAVGEGVTGFRKGSEVLGHTTTGSHADYVVVPAGNLVTKPPALSWETAGSLFLAGLAAEEAVRAVNVGSGDTIVVSAAAGGVGSMQAHLALGRGATVIGTCGERNFDYLRQIGVKPVVYGDGLTDRIRQLAPNGVDAFLDNFGQDNVRVAEDLGVPASKMRTSEDRREIELAAMNPTPERAAEQTRILSHLAELAAARTVNVLISGFYPLERVRDAFEDLEKRHARGKIVLGMNPVDDSFHGMGGRKVRDQQEST